MAVQAVLSMGRANMVSLAVALLVGIVAATVTTARAGLPPLAGMQPLTLVAAPALILSSVVLAPMLHVVTIASTRLVQGYQEFVGLSGNFGYRVELAADALKGLRGHALTGLGFLHPAVRYVQEVPKGTLIIDDLGALGILMTMGVFGVAFFYLAVGRGAYLAFRKRPFDATSGARWGLGVYLVAVLISSPTLVPTPVFLGLLLGLAAAGSALGERAPSGPRPGSSADAAPDPGS